MALLKKSCMPEFPEEKFAELSTPYSLNYVEKFRKNVTAASDPLRIKSCECTFWKSMHAFAIFALREKMQLPLFSPSCVAQKWTKAYIQEYFCQKSERLANNALL